MVATDRPTVESEKRKPATPGDSQNTTLYSGILSQLSMEKLLLLTLQSLLPCVIDECCLGKKSSVSDSRNTQAFIFFR